MPTNATVTPGWVFSTGDMVTASNINALGNPVVSIPDGSTYAIGVGALATPSLAVNGDADTGFAQVGGTDTLSFVTNSAEQFRFGVGTHLLPDGKLANPGLAFLSDVNSGVRWISSDKFAMVAGGVDRVTISSTGIDATGITLNGAPVLVSGLNPTTVYFSTDFFEGYSAAGFNATTATGGSVADCDTLIGNQFLGLVRIVGQSTTGCIAQLVSKNPMAAGDRQIWRLNGSGGTLSTPTNRYYRLIGYSNVNNESLSTGSGGAAYFVYDDASSAQWICVSRGSGAKQTTTTAVTFNVTHADMKFEIRLSGSDCKFYLNDTLVATHSTEYPLPTNKVYPFVKTEVTNGTVSGNSMDVDHFEMSYAYART